jgi:hypothetical protein
MSASAILTRVICRFVADEETKQGKLRQQEKAARDAQEAKEADRIAAEEVRLAEIWVKSAGVRAEFDKIAQAICADLRAMGLEEIAVENTDYLRTYYSEAIENGVFIESNGTDRASMPKYILGDWDQSKGWGATKTILIPGIRHKIFARNESIDPREFNGSRDVYEAGSIVKGLSIVFHADGKVVVREASLGSRVLGLIEYNDHFAEKSSKVLYTENISKRDPGAEIPKIMEIVVGKLFGKCTLVTTNYVFGEKINRYEREAYLYQHEQARIKNLCPPKALLTPER